MRRSATRSWELMNAVNDALAPLGVHHLDMPVTRERVWARSRTRRTGAAERPSGTAARDATPAIDSHGLSQATRRREQWMDPEVHW